jgi:hypothetical protein
MKPEWRTTTVVALCQHMLDTRDFDALPILADALEDAGCNDEALLRQAQDSGLGRVHRERLVNLIYSEETAAAVRWLEQVTWILENRTAENYYEEIVAAGHEGVTDEGMRCNMAGSNFFCEKENLREFFRNWSLVTGVAVPNEVQDQVRISCAC